jgi:2-polyprenyl-3-methyl-5-hydroxy-6-metoxy-1,4-benzoquinol methylase
MGLAVRHLETEVMDSASLDGAAHERALGALARLNWVSRVVPSLAGRIEAWDARALKRRAPVRVFDLACGGGDVALGLAAWARRRRLDLHVTGYDVSPRAVDYARERARRAGLAVTFREHDALAGALPEPADIGISTLFLHHLPRSEAAALLRRMGERAELVLVSDLDRTLAGFALAWAGSRLLTRSPVVHSDALASVRAAWTREELSALAEEAGLLGARIERVWPERHLLEWRRPGGGS